MSVQGQVPSESTVAEWLPERFPSWKDARTEWMEQGLASVLEPGESQPAEPAEGCVGAFPPQVPS